MSYTPDSEEIFEEKSDLIEAIKAFSQKIDHRVNYNAGEWSSRHRADCLEMKAKLFKIRMELEENW